MLTLPLPARLYVAAVLLVGAVIVAPVPWLSFDWTTFAVLLVVAVAAEASAVPLRQVAVSVGFSVALAAVLLLPASAAALITMISALANFGRRPAIRRYFNGSMLACAAAASGAVYSLAGGTPGASSNEMPHLGQALAAALTYCVVNGLVLSGVLKTTEGVSLVSAWRSIFSSSILGYLGYGLFGVIIAALWHADGGRVSAVLVLLPLYVARWAFSQYSEEREAYEATVQALVQAVETKDYYTRGHSERVSRAAVMIAKEIGMNDERTESLRLTGMLHDLGKLGVPTRLLQKSGSLTEDEFAAIQLHPVRGVEVVRGIEFLREAYNGIMHHHERMDGRGYPLGLSGKAIPEFARVIAVADAFDCMTSTRSYRSASTVEEALAEVRRCAGAQFDPEMVDALERAVEKQGWEPTVAATPAEATATSIAQFDDDDPTVRVPVIQADGMARVEPAVRVVPRHARSDEREKS